MKSFLSFSHRVDEKRTFSLFLCFSSRRSIRRKWQEIQFRKVPFSGQRHFSHKCFRNSGDNRFFFLPKSKTLFIEFRLTDRKCFSLEGIKGDSSFSIGDFFFDKNLKKAIKNLRLCQFDFCLLTRKKSVCSRFMSPSEREKELFFKKGDFRVRVGKKTSQSLIRFGKAANRF